MKHQHKQHTVKATVAMVPTPSGSSTKSSITRVISMTSLTELRHTRDDEPQMLLLHLIRCVSLYFHVLITHHLVASSLEIEELLTAMTTSKSLPDPSVRIEQRVHATMIASIRQELSSNQCDGGLTHDHRIFAEIKQIFRQHKLEVFSQCQILSNMLSIYLAELQHEPIVHCDSVGILASTLEYLHHLDFVNDKAATSTSCLLYPLVNAIDLLRAEQRECLDALTLLLKTLMQLSQRIETTPVSPVDDIIRVYTSSIFSIHSRNSSGKSTAISDLEMCFVRILIQHADHIFRHDQECMEQESCWTSDTDDEDDMEDDNEEPTTCTGCATPEVVVDTTHPTFPSKQAIPTLPLLNQTIVDENMIVCVDSVNNSKLEGPQTGFMSVGMAAAATTLAAALCVIFT